MTQLTTVDATFLHAENAKTHAHIAGLGIVDPGTCPGGRLTVPHVAELIRARAHLAARPLRQRLVQVPLGLDHPYWEDDPDFEPERHISEFGLPEPGSDRQLANLVAMLHEQPLDRSRPLWEMVLIQGLAGGRTAVYVKVHHAAIDGVMAAETLAALLDLTPEPRDLPADESVPARAPGTASMLGTGLLRTALHPVRSAMSAVRAAPYLDEVPGLSAVPGVGLMSSWMQGALRRPELPKAPRISAPPTPFNHPIGRRRAVACGSCRWPTSRRSGGPSAAASTTWSWRCARRRCGSGSTSAASCPSARWSRPYRCRCGAVRARPRSRATRSRS